MTSSYSITDLVLIISSGLVAGFINVVLTGTVIVMALQLLGIFSWVGALL